MHSNLYSSVLSSTLQTLQKGMRHMSERKELYIDNHVHKELQCILTIPYHNLNSLQSYKI